MTMLLRIESGGNGAPDAWGNTGMDAELIAIEAALTKLSDDELERLLAATSNKPRRSGACAGAESVIACGARSLVRNARHHAAG